MSGKIRVPRETAIAVARKVAHAIDPYVSRLAFCGSIRRGLETCGDVDILALARTGMTKDTLDAARALSSVDADNIWGEVVLRTVIDGVRTDVILTTVDSWGAALSYLTGSAEHNIAVRSWAKDHGWQANEYGVFRGTTKLPGSGETEGGFYRALGLRWLPPPLRTKNGHRGVVASRHRGGLLVTP